MTTASSVLVASRQPALAPTRTSMTRRGVLFLFLQMPVLALIVGHLLHLISLPVATFAVLVSVPALTAWVSYRKTVSEDADEPVHHLHRYALYALLPVAMFIVVQIPALFAADIAYWQLWSDVGAELIAEPRSGAWSLVAGVVVYALVGMGLVMGYYVLFRRHSMRNAALFLGATLSALFLYLFPRLSPAGAHPGTARYVTHAFAIAMTTVTAWAMPALWTRVSALRGRAAIAALTGLTLFVAAPFAVAVERATRWQPGEERRIDHAAFDRTSVELRSPVDFAGVDGGTARYDFALTFGPRTYATLGGAGRAVDAGPVTVEGRLVANGATVAWCAGHAAELDSPNAVRDPRAFSAAAQRLERVDIPVTCAGPAHAVTALCAERTLTVSWKADAQLVGGRTTQRRQFGGQDQTMLKLPEKGCP